MILVYTGNNVGGCGGGVFIHVGVGVSVCTAKTLEV